MFLIEPQLSRPIVANTVEEAVQKYRESARKDDEENRYFNVWNVETHEFFVVVHNVDADPTDNPHVPEFERVVEFSKADIKRLIEAMVHKAQCDDVALQQLCDMAACQINTKDAFDNWVGETDETND